MDGGRLLLLVWWGGIYSLVALVLLTCELHDRIWRTELRASMTSDSVLILQLKVYVS